MKNLFQWSQVSAFRLTRHHFVDQNRADLTAVCQDVCVKWSKIYLCNDFAVAVV